MKSLKQDPTLSLVDKKYWKHTSQLYLNAANERARKLIDEYTQKIYGAACNRIKWEDLDKLPEAYVATLKKPDENEEIPIKLRAAIDVLEYFEYIRNHQNQLDKWELGLLTLIIGTRDQMLRNIYTTDEVIETLTKNLLSEKGRKSRKKGWDEEKDLIYKAAARAKKLWDEGDSRLHNEMANDLLNPGVFPEFEALIIRPQKDLYRDSIKIFSERKAAKYLGVRLETLVDIRRKKLIPFEPITTPARKKRTAEYRRHDLDKYADDKNRKTRRSLLTELIKEAPENRVCGNRGVRKLKNTPELL